MADRQAEISDKFLDAIDQALDKFMADLKATKSVRQPDGSIVEMPAWYMTPRDLCLLIDRFQVLFARPSSISQHQGFSVTSELSEESLREFIEATRGRAGPSPDGGVTAAAYTAAGRLSICVQPKRESNSSCLPHTLVEADISSALTRAWAWSRISWWGHSAATSGRSSG